jgi:hypothetical protein
MGKLVFWKWAGITAGLVTAVLFMAQVSRALTGVPVPQGGTGLQYPTTGWQVGSVLLGNGTNSLSTTTRGDLTGSGITVTGGTNAILGSGVSLTLDATGNWTGTFDGQDGTYYLNATNLTNFGVPFYTLFHATTTDALSEGLSNLYYTATRDIRYSTVSDHGVNSLKINRLIS